MMRREFVPPRKAAKFLVVAAWALSVHLVGLAYGIGIPPSAVPFAAVSGEALGDQYGSAVSSAGDVNGDGYADVIVGDYGYDSSHGRAYVYLGKKAVQLGLMGFKDPAPPAVVVVTGDNAGDNFGYAVSSAGDVNGDGYDDILVGAPNYSVGLVNRGRVYVYFGGPAMDNVPDLILTGETAFSYFGSAVAAAGDLNGDGYDDFVVGAHGFASGTDSERGRVYVYYGGPTPDTVADLTITGRNNGDKFGFSVSSAGHVNADQAPDLIVGAPGYGSFTGRAYLFFGGANPDTTEDQIFTGEAAGDQFGISVSAADTDGDGYDDLLVGAPYHVASRGRVYVFQGGVAPVGTPHDAINGENDGDLFGLSVAGLGDPNRDGMDEFAVGAPGYHSFNGKAYVYWALPGNHVDFGYGGESGWSVASAGDVDGDGCPDLVYGRPGITQAGDAVIESIFPYRAVQPNGGEQWVVGQKVRVKWYGGGGTAVWLSRNGGATWDQLASGVYNMGNDPQDPYATWVDLTAPGPATNMALIRVGDTYLTPPTVATSDVGDGVFQIVDAVTPSQIAVQTDTPKINALGSSAYETLGAALGGGDWNGDGFADVAIGAPSSPGGGSPGHVYLYRGGSKADGTADLVLSGQALDDEFGYSVAFVGDVNGDGFADLAVGAPLNDATGTDAGSVYVYFGGPAADGVADVVLRGLVPRNQFGSIVAGAGDVNGDGMADLLVSTSVGIGAGQTFLFLGGPAMDGTADLTLYEGAGFGTSVSGIGDINRDGYADWIVGSPAQSGGQGKAYVYFGSAVPDPTPHLVLSGDETFGQKVAGAGDLDGDGFADFAVAEPGSDRVVVYRGGPSPGTAASLKLTGLPGDMFGTGLAAGDVNGDSYADLVVGEPGSGTAGPGMGRVQVFFGGPGMDASADVSIATTAFGTNAYAGYSVAIGGDFVGDGFNDLLVGAPLSSKTASLAGGAALYDVNRFQLVTPNGGGTWQVGATVNVSWYGAEPANVLLSADGGISYAPLLSNVGGKAFNSVGVLVPHLPTKFAMLKIVPSDLTAVPPSPVVPPSPILPPNPIMVGSDRSDSLFTINASVTLLSLMAAPSSEKAGAVITWNTDPGPSDLQGYRLERAVGSEPWKVVATMTKETRIEDPDAGLATRYRLYSVNGLGEMLYLGETAFHSRAPLAAGPLPFHGGKLAISFATAGGLGGAPSPAEVVVFDVQGRLVRRVAAGNYSAGYQSAEWDGRDEQGRDVAAGVYLLRSRSGGTGTTLKLVVAR